MESNSLKCSIIQMINSIDLKFNMYVIGHCSTNYIDFGEFLLQEHKKGFLCITTYGVKLLETSSPFPLRTDAFCGLK